MHSSLCAGCDASGVMERYWKNGAGLNVELDSDRYTDEMGSTDSLRLVLRITRVGVPQRVKRRC